MATTIFTKNKFNIQKEELYKQIMQNVYEIDQVQLTWDHGEQYHIISSLDFGWVLIRDKNYQFSLAIMSNGFVIRKFSVGDNIRGCIDENVVLNFFY